MGSARDSGPARDGRPGSTRLSRLVGAASATPLRIGVVYLAFGLAALAVSDVFLSSLVSEPLLSRLQVVKGLAEVLLTVGLIYALTSASRAAHRETTAELERHREELRVLHRLLRHNLRNDLNLIRGESERLREGVDGDLEASCDVVLETTQGIVDYTERARAIRKLTELETRRTDLAELVPAILADYRESGRGGAAGSGRGDDRPDGGRGSESGDEGRDGADPERGRRDRADSARTDSVRGRRDRTDALGDGSGAIASAAPDDVEVRSDVPEEAPVWANELFETALAELVTNAVVHGDDEPTVVVSVDPDCDRPGETLVEVRDDGPGLPAYAEAVLRGEQRDQLVHMDGLGLWLAYLTVVESGGEFEIPDDAEGTTIRMYLPTAARRTHWLFGRDR